MRIAIAGLHIESSSYNPSLTRTEDFTILRGVDLLASPDFAYLTQFEATFLPVFHARAVPGAPIARDTYDAFKAEVLDGIAALGPLDGIYLPMHGAAFVEGMEDAEADFISAIRSLVGPDMPIGASYDLHGNLSQPIIDALDTFTAYRTAPHIDVAETGARAVRLLIRRIDEGPGAGLCWCPIPVALPGEKTSTEDEPARSLYARLPGVEGHGIWDASLMVGYVWADEPRVTACAVLTGTDRAAMQREASALAQAYWDARDDFTFGTETGPLDHCLTKALAADTYPAILADSGDNPTAGGAGDRADVLTALIEAGEPEAIVAGIADRPATKAAYAAGLNATITTPIGGTIDPSSASIEVTAKVIHLHDTSDPTDHQAVLQIGGIRLVVTARRRPFHDLEDLRRLGLEPTTARLIVVKSGYLSPDLSALAGPSLMALTSGIVDQDIERLRRYRTRRPIFPLDRDFRYGSAPCFSRRTWL